MVNGSEMSNPIISKLETFGRIADDDARRLSQIISADSRSVSPKVDIITEGANPTSAHALVSGLACRYKMLKDGRRQIVAYLVPGDFCDLHSFLLKSTDHSIAPIVPSQVVYISKDHIDEIMKRPSLFKPMMMSTLIDEAIMRAWITNIGRRPAVKRVAHLFCELHARHSRIGLTDGGSFILPVTQVDLADTAGLSVVHVNRSLQQLKEENLVKIKGKKITIGDVDTLRRYCGFDVSYLCLAGA